MTTPVRYTFVFPRSLKVGDTVLVDAVARRITRINANGSRVTVYWQQAKQRGHGSREVGYTYWVAVGEVRAKLVTL